MATMLRERPVAEVTRVQERSHVTEWVMGIFGLLAAAVGAWMYYVPTDWFLGGLAEGWYLGMFTGAGVLLTGAFGFATAKIRSDETAWTTRSVLTALLAVAALAGAVTFALIWII